MGRKEALVGLRGLQAAKGEGGKEGETKGGEMVGGRSRLTLPAPPEEPFMQDTKGYTRQERSVSNNSFVALLHEFTSKDLAEGDQRSLSLTPLISGNLTCVPCPDNTLKTGVSARPGETLYN